MTKVVTYRTNKRLQQLTGDIIQSKTQGKQIKTL